MSVIYFISAIISFCVLPSAEVLIIAPVPSGRLFFIIYSNLFLSSKFIIFCDIVIIDELGVNTKYLLGILICVDILAPFLSLLSFFT
ncbi:hypothetical protein D3C72_2193030 [compost metagenome]